jgi:hypothetical protein
MKGLMPTDQFRPTSGSRRPKGAMMICEIYQGQTSIPCPHCSCDGVIECPLR